MHDINADLPRTHFCCPCCGYPTLDERGGYDICGLCNWEDDGQDDPHADEVWGGPNKQYSLTQARGNFKRYLIMYSPDGDFRVIQGQTEDEIEAKKEIIRAYDAIPGAEESERRLLWMMIGQNWKVLRQDLDYRLEQYERQLKRARRSEQ